MRPRSHTRQKDSTRHITFRIPEDVALSIESEAAKLNVSTSHVLGGILQRWSKWDRYEEKLRLVPVPREMLSKLVTEDEKTVRILASQAFLFFKEAVVFMKGKYDLKRAIETLEEYMHATGMTSDHTVNGAVHCFTVQHGMGVAWSMLVQTILRELFSEFVPDAKVDFDMYNGTVSARIALGSDWDQHDY